MAGSPRESPLRGCLCATAVSSRAPASVSWAAELSGPPCRLFPLKVRPCSLQAADIVYSVICWPWALNLAPRRQWRLRSAERALAPRAPFHVPALPLLLAAWPGARCSCPWSWRHCWAAPPPLPPPRKGLNCQTRSRSCPSFHSLGASGWRTCLDARCCPRLACATASTSRWRHVPGLQSPLPPSVTGATDAGPSNQAHLTLLRCSRPPL